MLSLDIDLAELLGGLLEVLLGLVKLLLQQLNLAGKVLACSLVGVCLLTDALELTDLVLCLLEAVLGKLELVGEGRVFLVTLKEGLVKLTISD